MKKFLVGLLTVALAASMLVGCGKKEEKTKKKQLYSLGIKDIRKKNLEEITKIRKEFNKLVLVFNQLKHFRAIDDVEVAMKGIR